MNRKAKAKDEWIRETQMFQRIAKTGEESYLELAVFYDKTFGRMTAAQQEVIAENMKTQRVIVQQAEKAARERRN